MGIFTQIRIGNYEEPKKIHCPAQLNQTHGQKWHKRFDLH